MEKSRIIIAIISIAVSVILGIFLFNHPDFIKVMTSNYAELTLTPTEKFFKNAVISIACGSTIYIIFYAIPHEYKKLMKEKNE